MTREPHRWCSGRASVSGADDRGYDTRSGHTIYFKSGSTGFMVAVLALRLTGWCQDKWTRSTGNVPRKRHNITEDLSKAA